MKTLISILMLLFLASPAWSADEWLKTRPAVTDDRADYPADVVANNAALDRVLANYREGMTLSYSTAAAVSVSTGEVVCSTAAGDVRKMRQNTAVTSVGWADIDTGAEEASKTYYIYAVADADATTATFKVSLSSTAPTGITSFKRLGSFYNNADSNIGLISNDNDVKKLGDWSAKSSGVVYQATSDGFVVANSYSSGGGTADIIIYSDAFNPPTTIRVEDSAVTAGDGRHASATIPVKIGDYYKAVAGGTASIYFVPLN
jgi:hypothetical protein